MTVAGKDSPVGRNLEQTQTPKGLQSKGEREIEVARVVDRPECVAGLTTTLSQYR